MTRMVNVPVGRSHRSRRLPLRVEPLEPRRLLAGDATGGSAALGGGDSGVGLETFSSAEAYADWLTAQATASWGHLFGQPVFAVPFFDGVISLPFMPRVTGGVEPGLVASVPLEYAGPSDTNTQVTGVDEADLVETDGDTLYALSERRLSIVTGFAEDQPRLIGRFDLDSPGQVAGMYLAGDRLTILSRQWNEAAIAGSPASFGWFPQPAITRPRTLVTVLDVSDPEAAVVAGRTVFDGELLASRMVDGQLRMVLDHPLVIPPPEVVAAGETAGPLATGPSPAVPIPAVAGLTIMPRPPIDRLPTGRYETAEAYAVRVRQQLVASMTPQVYRVDAAGNPLDLANLVDPARIDIPEPGQLRQLTTITAVDPGGSPADTVGLFTAGSVEVFATADDLYLFDDGQGSGWPADVIRPMIWLPPVTGVTQVAFAPPLAALPAVSLAAQGEFTGRLLNQFAADAADGLLRVVVERPGEGSGVVVLDRAGERLVEVGGLAGLAPGEDLYAVRFVADRAYFVTFIRTDPLFVVDLSDPTAPTLLGELHVPGFSDYIQPLSEGFLLTIGRDADPRTGAFRGLQLSIFDVREPTSPALLHRATLAGGRDATTPITGSGWRRGDGDHLALGFFPEPGVITIPVSFDGWTEPADPWGEPVPSTQQLEVFAIDVAAGISRLGSIDHAASIDRSVQIAGRLVAVSEGEVSLHDFADPSARLAAVPLGDEPGVTGITATRLPDQTPALPPPITALLDRAVSGLPLHRSWTVKGAETVGDRTVLYAEHASGAVHRLTSTAPIEAAGWAAFGFESVGNLDSIPVREFIIGPAAEPPADRGLPEPVGEAVLGWFGLTRDASGRIRRAGGLAASR